MNKLNLTQLILLIIIGLGFIGGIIPLLGTVVMVYVIPVAIASLVISIIAKKLIGLTIPNLVLALIGLIPLVGTVASIAGIVITVIAIVKISKQLND